MAVFIIVTDQRFEIESFHFVRQPDIVAGIAQRAGILCGAFDPLGHWLSLF